VTSRTRRSSVCTLAGLKRPLESIGLVRETVERGPAVDTPTDTAPEARTEATTETAADTATDTATESATETATKSATDPVATVARGEQLQLL
jgi:hypothetical protein